MHANRTTLSTTKTMLAAALAMAVVACSGGSDAPPGATTSSGAPDREWTDAARVEAMASKLQACSYEGKPVNVEAGQLNGQAPADCKTMVDKIMGFTGLPANFVVTAGPVPNALAVILLDNQRMPQRVIAFNPNFIDATQRVTGGGEWGPTSIMAHEIGHHLSGHTITSGGSRPNIELEADKFSGFVLYKMGAPLAEATKAMSSLGSEAEQATHPAKSRRIAAITEGWQEACRQSGGNCSAGTTPVTPPVQPGMPTTVTKVTLPAPSAQSIPFKYGRFVVDETGKLDAKALGELDRKLHDLATKQGVELVFLVVNDLHGMNANDYAWAMMRQLRIGKLDLGNGGVIVVAPNQGQSGLAFAPGVAKQLEFDKPLRSIDRWMKDDWTRYCVGAKADPRACARSSTFALPSDYMLKRLSEVKWRIRFTNIEDAIAYSIKQEDERRAARKAGKKPEYDHENSPLGSLARFTATVTELDPEPDPENPQSTDDLRGVNRYVVTKQGWKAVLVKTESGQETTLYMQPQTASLMPSGKLQVGKQYSFVGEIKTTGRFHMDGGVHQMNPGVWLFSYEALR